MEKEDRIAGVIAIALILVSAGWLYGHMWDFFAVIVVWGVILIALVGWAQYRARKYHVTKIELTQEQKEANRTAGLVKILIGGVVCILGIIATNASYSAASPGGNYTLFYGAIIMGGLFFLWGLAQLATGESSR
jgi:uncharacterized membrane protein